MFLDCFDVMMLKIIFKKEKNNNFDKYVSEKHVEKLSLPLFQTIHPDVISDGEAFFNFCLMVEDRWKQT